MVRIDDMNLGQMVRMDELEMAVKWFGEMQTLVRRDVKWSGEMYKGHGRCTSITK